MPVRRLLMRKIRPLAAKRMVVVPTTAHGRNLPIELM